MTVTVPLFALNQVSEERCEWLVPGMLKDKVQALLKSLHAAAALAPGAAARIGDAHCGASCRRPKRSAHGSLIDALLKRVRDATSLDVKRADFKLDMLPPHLFMNFRVVDEHGRQLGMGRNLGALKARAGRAGARRVPGAGGAEAAGLRRRVRRRAAAGSPSAAHEAQRRRQGQSAAEPQPPAGQALHRAGPSASCPS